MNRRDTSWAQSTHTAFHSSQVWPAKGCLGFKGSQLGLRQVLRTREHQMEPFSMMRSKSEREKKREDGSPQWILGPPQSTPAWHIPKASPVCGSHRPQ